MAKKRIRGKSLLRVRLRIKEVAESKGFTQTKLSRVAQLQYPTVHNLWTHEYTDASISTLAKVANALKCSVSDLFVIENIPDE